MVRDLAVAAHALGARGLHLDVLLLDGGQEQASALAAKTAADFRPAPGAPEGRGPTDSGPSGPCWGRRHLNHRVVP